MKFECFSAYFPTSWDADAEVEGMYEILQLLLDNCRVNGAVPIFGGDFNASIGVLLDGRGDDDDNDVDLLGTWGLGCQNARGTWLVQWILSNGLRIASRQKHCDLADSWTCKRSSDAFRLISYFQMSWLWWNQFGMTSWYLLALITDVSIAECHSKGVEQGKKE